MNNQLESIVNGTVKIFNGKNTNVSGAPLNFLDQVNADGASYKFSDLPAGDYTYSATASGKGTVVGGFNVPDDKMLAEQLDTKYIPPIVLTPAVTDGVSVNLRILNIPPSDPLLPVTTGVRVLIGGNDAVYNAGNTLWEATSIPVTMNGTIEVIPTNPATYQNLFVTRPFTDASNSFILDLYPPFTVLFNINAGSSIINSVAKVYVKAPGSDSFVEIFTGESGQFVYNYGSNGAYEVRVEADNYVTKTMNYTFTYPANGVMVRTIFLDLQGATNVSWRLNLPAGTSVYQSNPPYVSGNSGPILTNGVITALEGSYLVLSIVEAAPINTSWTYVVSRVLPDGTQERIAGPTAYQQMGPTTILTYTMSSNEIIYVSRGTGV